MTLDSEMAEIATVFFQESREGLDAMEAGLLNLDAVADREVINTIFRAAHSIKGGAATFGFAELAAFTHGVETLLDEMRNGVRAVTPQTIQALLQSCDCLREMLTAVETGQPPDQQRMAAANREINQILGEARGSVLPSVSTTLPRVPASAGTTLEISGWRIVFEPIADLLRVRNEPTRMFAELARLGVCTARANLSRLPQLESLDPESCYLSWDIEVLAPVGRQALDDIFDWVDDRCRLEITPIGPVATAAAAGPVTASAAPAPRSLPTLPEAPSMAPPVAVATCIVENVTVGEAARGSRPPRSFAGKAGSDAGSIRVATEKVDSIINLVGELLITQSMLCGFADGIKPGELPRLRQGLAQLARNTRELQESVMQIRMLPISFAFNRFPRIVHDLSHKLGKKIELKLSGEGTELDKTVLEKVSDPLVHLVRNALDHGLETPERRVAAGKTDTGTLELSAFHEGGHIIIEVRDDGAGLNRSKILQKARERSLVTPDQELSDEQIHNLIFMPGFSTAEQVSDVSGRGVGMDVVRRNVNDLGGHVQIFSKEGEGSTIRIRLPLTLAILDGQLVRVGREVYVISLLDIIETIQVSSDKINSLTGRTEVFRLRDEYLPIVKLCDHFSIEPDSRNAEDGLLVIVEADGRRVGILVDDLLAQQQVVIKSLESNFKPVPGIAGATILGDGMVALILDVSKLIRSVSGRRVGARAAHAA